MSKTIEFSEQGIQQQTFKSYKAKIQYHKTNVDFELLSKPGCSTCKLIPIVLTKQS